MTQADAASLLGISTRTLTNWSRHWNAHRLAADPRGRHPGRIDRDSRKQLLDFLRGQSPRVSVHTLRERFPHLSRRALEAVLRRWRRFARRRKIGDLTWTTPGSVWATDFTDPPAPVDGVYPHLLTVRDLASGFQLLALPTIDLSADTATAAIESLCAEHGPPLVLKSDNGSAFIDHRFQQALERNGIQWLPSPVATPTYNGACEAGNGSIKTRAHHHAAHFGRPGHWTCDDLEFARLEANATARPRGPNPLTPDQIWNTRTLLQSEQRRRFTQSVLQHEADFRNETGYTSADKSAHTRGLVIRTAVRRTLVALDYLRIRRRSITLTLNQRNHANIT